jgi:hypothetical protein
MLLMRVVARTILSGESEEISKKAEAKDGNESSGREK